MHYVPELISTVYIFLLETEYDGTKILDYKLFESALKPEATQTFTSSFVK